MNLSDSSTKTHFTANALSCIFEDLPKEIQLEINKFCNWETKAQLLATSKWTAQIIRFAIKPLSWERALMYMRYLKPCGECLHLHKRDTVYQCSQCFEWFGYHCHPPEQCEECGEFFCEYCEGTVVIGIPLAAFCSQEIICNDCILMPMVCV